MLFQISALCEVHVANIAYEGSHVIVLSEVVVNVAALEEHGAAVVVLAVEMKFVLLRL